MAVKKLWRDWRHYYVTCRVGEDSMLAAARHALGMALLEVYIDETGGLVREER